MKYTFAKNYLPTLDDIRNKKDVFLRDNQARHIENILKELGYVTRLIETKVIGEITD